MATDPFIGEMKTFAFDFAPRNWAQCNEQLLPILQNQALFSLLGTTYGGNGTTTLPCRTCADASPWASARGQGCPTTIWVKPQGLRQ